MKKTRTLGNIKKFKPLKSYFIKIMRTTVQPANTCTLALAFKVSYKDFLYTMVKSLKTLQILNPDKISPLLSYFINIMRTTVQKLPPPWPSESVGRLSLLPIFLLQKASKAKEGRAPSAFASALRPL